MFAPIQFYTPEEFVIFATLPENTDKKFEYLRGVMWDVTSNQKTSNYAAVIMMSLGAFMGERDLGDVTGGDGGYIIGDGYFVPDIAFISRQRQSEPPDVTYNPLMPDFIVEVISPSDYQSPKTRIDDKLATYRQAQIPLLWMVHPKHFAIDVYEYGEFVRTAKMGDTLNGTGELTGWTIAVQRIFNKK